MYVSIGENYTIPKNSTLRPKYDFAHTSTEVNPSKNHYHTNPRYLFCRYSHTYPPQRSHKSHQCSGWCCGVKPTTLELSDVYVLHSTIHRFGSRVQGRHLFGSDEAKTQIVVGAGRNEPIATGNTRVPRVAVPTTTTVDSVGA